MPRVLGPIVPAGPFYGMQDVYLRGGLRVVANNSERDALPVSLRYPGMLALTRDTGSIWRLEADNTTWTWIHTGGWKTYTWASSISVDMTAAAMHEVVLGGATSITITNSAAGRNALLYLRNGQAQTTTVTWTGVRWLRYRPSRLGPNEEVVVRLLGKGDETLAVWDRQGTWTAVLPAQDKVVSYWTLDRKAGSVFADDVGNKAMSAGGFDTCPGLRNDAAVQLSQTGSVASLLRVSDSAFQLSASGGFALRLWFRTPASSPAERLVTWADTDARLNTGDLRVSYSAGNLTTVLFNDTARAVTLPFTPDAWWHRLVITWDAVAATLKVVLDGQSASATPISLAGAVGDMALNLGTITAAGVPGTCFDEVVFWKGVALTDSQIEDDWAGGLISGAAPRPVAVGEPGGITFDYSLEGAPVW